MKKRSDENPDWDSQRMKIIGLGESSIRKSYYPELQQRLDELLKKNEDLNAAYEELTATQEELQQNYDELARRERELLESTNLLQVIYDGSPDMIYIHHADGHIIDVNENVVRNLGFSREEMMQVRPEDTSGRGYTTAMAMEKVRLALRGESPEFEWVMKRKDGSQFPVEIRLRRLELVDGAGNKEYRILAIIRDLTRPKQAEQAQRESDEKFRNIMEYIPLGIHIYHLRDDGTLILTGANPAADTIFGISHDQKIGQPLVEIFPKVAKTPLLQEYRRVAETGEPWQSDEITYKDEQTERTFSVFAFPISSENLVAMFRDITEARRAAFSLDQARKKLNLLNTVTFQDIQSAAFSLSAYHVLSDKHLKDPEIRYYHEKESALIQKIILSLNFAKDFQDMGKQSPRWQNVNQTFLFALSHLDFLKISHTIHVGNLEIYADPLLEKAFSNLMENVLRHGESATAVQVRYEERPDGLVLFIEDNGVGILREEKHIIFDRSYGKDTGLGLFLVREILSITGMTIRETGEPGKGARFGIHVPPRGYRFRSLN
jgi:PAS domain S-box-containing protein